MKHFAFIFCLLICFQITACAEQQPSSTSTTDKPVGFKAVTLLNNLNHPWSIAFLPDKSFLITERGGRLLLFNYDGNARVIVGLPQIKSENQGGLLDVITDPEFEKNRTIYISYVAKGQGGYGTEVASAVLDETSLKNLKVIFRATPKTPGHKHFGSRLLIMPDSSLIVTLGEKGQWPNDENHNAQNPSNHLGTIVRINRDGSIPNNNPFVNIKGFKPEVLTYGNRNVQGIALHPETGKIWFHEHGPLGGDELNILKPGANYGWPIVTFGKNYNGTIITNKRAAPGIEPPVAQWTPCIAPSGMAFYDGDAFPQWKGNIFIGALVQRHLRRVILNGERVVRQEVLLKSLGERIRDVRTGPDGYLYILTDSENGRLLRLEPRESKQ